MAELTEQVGNQVLKIGGNFIKEYPCIISAVKELGIRSSGISNCCAGRYSQSGGYKWKYKEEKENV